MTNPRPSEANPVRRPRETLHNGCQGLPPSSSGLPQPSQEAIQAAVMQEQQKALVQQVIAKLTEVSFDQCIDRPEASLTSRQRNCIHTVVGKYLDTSEFVIGRATKGAK